MALMLDEIDDFVINTISNFKRGKFVDIYQPYQEYLSAKFFKKGVDEQGGESVKFNLKKSATGNARVSGLYDVNQTNVSDTMVQASVPWRFTTGNWGYDILEDMFQTDRETIVKQLVVREMDCKFDMVELNETLLWNPPAGPEDKKPWSLPFWVQPDPTSGISEGGFVGGNPTNFPAGAAGVDSDTYPRWRNWAFNYSQVTPGDLIRKIKKAIVYTRFMPPVPHPQLAFGDASREIYTTYSVVEPLERLAESRNDNLGSDVARYMNQVTIGGVPVRMAFYVDANDPDGTMYGIDWGTFRPAFRKNVNMRRQGPFRAPNQRNVREVHYDTAMNYVCYDRRRMWRATKV